MLWELKRTVNEVVLLKLMSNQYLKVDLYRPASETQFE